MDTRDLSSRDSETETIDGTACTIVRDGDIAIKRADDAEVNELLVTEYAFMSSCNHPNIAKIVGIRWRKGLIEIRLPWYNRNLQSMMKKIRDPMYWFDQLLEGLSYIHHAGIVHSDIKPENILISDDNQLVICDFGISIMAHTPIYFVAQTVTYRAPEMALSLAKVNLPSLDMWSAGVILYEMINRRQFLPEDCYDDPGPFLCSIFDATKETIMKLSDETYVNKLFDLCDNPYVARLLVPKPCMRATAEELLRDRYDDKKLTKHSSDGPNEKIKKVNEDERLRPYIAPEPATFDESFLLPVDEDLFNHLLEVCGRPNAD